MRDLDILNVSRSTGKASFGLGEGYVTGIRLLAQRVIVILLTNYNETLRQSEGTSFVSNMRSGQISLAYVGLLMTSAMASTIEILSGSADDNATDEERIADLRIQNIELDGDRILFDLYVSNKAGESTTISSNT
jgi:hypothetical protein